MSLGNVDITNFTPKKRSTTAELLKSAPKQTDKKEERFELRIQSDILLLFKDICKANGTDASKVLRNYIIETVQSGTI